MAHKKAYALVLLVVVFLSAFLRFPIRSMAAVTTRLSWDYSESNLYKEVYVSDCSIMTKLEPGCYYSATIEISTSTFKAGEVVSYCIDDIHITSDAGQAFMDFNFNGGGHGSSGTFVIYFQALASRHTFYLSARLSGTSGSIPYYGATCSLDGTVSLRTNNYSKISVASGDYARVSDVQSIVDSGIGSVNDNLKVQGSQIDASIKEQTKVEKEQAETSKGILAKMTDFFGSFFDNLIEMVKGLVIPSSEDLLAFLEEVNAWFGERLGFIWYPFSLAVDMVSALAGGSADQTFRVPALSLSILGESYVIWGEIEVDLDAFGIFAYVRFFTSALLVSGIVRMAVSKWDEWIGGRDS